MNVSLSWLAEYTDLPADTARIESLLTFAGIEVEAVHRRGADIPFVVTARILESAQHPNADRLSVCSVDDGSGTPRQIVCGAKNYRVGDVVPLALPGAVLPGDFKIKTGKLRGVESHGMLCSAKELELSDEAAGLLILPPGTSVGVPISHAIPPDTLLELEITPNRPDLLSHFGIAREISALTGSTLRMPAAMAAGTPKTSGTVAVRVESAEDSPFYSARRIHGVKVGPSPDWLRRRLESVGLRSINNIVDVTNFVMLELGQPLHAFDAAKLQGGIAVRRAVAGEVFAALDGKTYPLRPQDVVIADDQGVVALAGVMGGMQSGVTDATVDLVLESARFLPAAVRRTSRELGLASDSSHRFERGVDPGGMLGASARAVALILEVAGGDASEGPVVVGDLRGEGSRVRLRDARANVLLGAVIPRVETERILGAIGLEKVLESPEQMEWRVPTFRQDLRREVDLVEEIIRIHGIERLPAGRTRRFVAASDADHAYDFRLGLCRRLAGLGFREARTLTLVGAQISHATGAREPLRLRNPLNDEQGFLRQALVPGLLQALAFNMRHGAVYVRLFEAGRVFGGEVEEEMHCGLVMSGPIADPSWRAAHPRNADLFDVKGVLSALVPGSVRFERTEDPHLAMALHVLAGDRVVGRAGQLSPAASRALDATAPVLVAELRVEVLQALAPGMDGYAAPDRYPAVVRDMALVVPRTLPHVKVLEVIGALKEPLLAGVEVFDVFEDPSGERVAAGMKSMAYSLTYRSSERTLTVDEVNAAHQRIKASLVGEVGAVFRE